MGVFTIVHIVVDIGLLAVAAYFGYYFYRDFRSATGSTWQRILAAASHSQTILWSRLVTLGGVVVEALINLANFVGAPGVSSAIQQYLKPEYIPWIMIAIAVITELARRRPGSTDPVT